MQTQVGTYVTYCKKFRVKKHFATGPDSLKVRLAENTSILKSEIFYFTLNFQPNYQTTCLTITKYHLDIVLAFICKRIEVNWSKNDQAMVLFVGSHRFP